MGAVVSRPPLIGVSTSEVRRAGDHSVVPQGEPSRRELALGERYLDSVRSAGGLPVILTPVDGSAIDPLLERLDAVCLSGGPDLHPSAYGAEAHDELGPTEPELDLFELALARRAVRRGMPVLGICRGAQVLNVALGGTLHQHLPDLSEQVEHRQQVAGHQVTHEVKLAPGSRPSVPPLTPARGCARSAGRRTTPSRRSKAPARASCAASSGTPSASSSDPSISPSSKRSSRRARSTR